MITIGLGAFALFGAWGITLDTIRRLLASGKMGPVKTVLSCFCLSKLSTYLVAKIMEIIFNDDDVDLYVALGALWVLISGVVYNINSCFYSPDKVGIIGKIVMFPATVATKMVSPLTNFVWGLFAKKDKVALHAA